MYGRQQMITSSEGSPTRIRGQHESRREVEVDVELLEGAQSLQPRHVLELQHLAEEVRRQE